MADFYRSLSSAVHPEAWEAAIPTLIGLAKIWRPSRVARFADTELRLRLDPDGVLPKDKELAEPGNRMSPKQRADGWWKYEGYLEPESGSLWIAQLEPGCKPRPTTELEGPDTRSSTERLGDSLSEWITHAATAPAIEGGEPPQLMVTIDWEDLRRGLGHAELGPNQQPIPVSQARRLACAAQVLPIVLGSRSQLLDIGQSSRTISTGIRRAVVNRDKHCSFPGCDRPSSVCQAHHVIEWQHGGASKPENLALLCGHHHRMVHHTDWEVRMSQGFPEFLPPSYLDPERKPRTNRSPYS